MTENKRLKILFVANNSTSRSEMQHMANYLSQYADTQLIGGASGATTSSTKSQDSFVRGMIRRIGGALHGMGLIPPQWKRYRFKAKLKALEIQAQQLLQQVDFVFVSGDRSPEVLEGAIINQCRKYQIPSAIAPTSVFGEKRDLIYFRRTKAEHWANEQLANQYPHIIDYDSETGRHISFYPIEQLNTLSEWNLLSANPWLMGGGQTSHVCVVSQAWADRLIAGGIPETKVIVTGHLQHDILAKTITDREIIRRRLTVEYQLDGNKVWRIFAPPPLFEHQIFDEEKHWRELESIQASLKSAGESVEVLISLHPKMDANKYRTWASERGMTIIHEPLANWLAAGDVFISSFSSTAEWALGLGIPVVVFDFFGFDLDYYDQVPGITVIRDIKQLRTVVREQVSEASRGKVKISFDGKAGERIWSLVRKQTAHVESLNG